MSRPIGRGGKPGADWTQNARPRGRGASDEQGVGLLFRTRAAVKVAAPARVPTPSLRGSNGGTLRRSCGPSPALSGLWQTFRHPPIPCRSARDDTLVHDSIVRDTDNLVLLSNVPESQNLPFRQSPEFVSKLLSLLPPVRGATPSRPPVTYAGHFSNSQPRDNRPERKPGEFQNFVTLTVKPNVVLLVKKENHT